MGVFDIFGREPKMKTEDRFRFDGNSGEPERKDGKAVAFFTPTSYSDVEKIIDALKVGKNAVVKLGELKTETTIRILDMLSGAVYALNGGVCEIEKNIFMFSPSGVEVK